MNTKEFDLNAIEEAVWRKLDRKALPGACLTVVGDAMNDYREAVEKYVTSATAARLADLLRRCELPKEIQADGRLSVLIDRWACLIAEELTQPETPAARHYRECNPLGGPARIFDAMASRVRAGEDFYAVLKDYGFQVIPGTDTGSST